VVGSRGPAGICLSFYSGFAIKLHRIAQFELTVISWRIKFVSSMKHPSLPRLTTLCILLGSIFTCGLQAQDTSPEAPAPATPAPDFGDHSSETLTTKAWEAFTSKNYADALAYTAKCIELYSAQAKEMQNSLESKAPAETAASLWALNDVGTCYYIRGQVFEAQGKSAEALAAYKKLVNEFSFAQTWDTKGWFWSPADAAKQRIKVVEFDTL
jgi:hypothetical protein